MYRLKKTDAACLGGLPSRLRGGALYIAIIISIVLGIILTMFILIASYNQQGISAFTQSVQLHYNLRGAFQLAQSAYFTTAHNNRWLKNNGNDDSVKIKKKYWGAYLLINAQTKNRHNKLSQSGLYGTWMSSDTGLVISDNSRPVGISGTVIFKANCYLPKAGLKPAYIEGQSYQGGSQNTGFIKRAPQAIALPASSLMEGLEEEQNRFNPAIDSLVASLPLTFNNSFGNKTLVWECAQNKLSGFTLKNNIKLVCRQVVIDSSCHFENILIVCNKVRFGKGFSGRVHIIATDSIIAEADCRFNYPSSFVLFPPNNDSLASLRYIRFNEHCRFFGGILALRPYEAAQSPGRLFVKLNAQSEVNGFVYCSDYIHVEGRLYANVIGNKLLLKTPSAVYENHLLACEIDPQKYAHLLAVPLVFNPGARLLRCQTMN